MNTFTIKRGQNPPDKGILENYELGFCNENQSLYIGIPSGNSPEKQAIQIGGVINPDDPTNFAGRLLSYALPINGGTLKGSLNMNGNRITGVGTPILDSDAATKAYVDSRTLPDIYDHTGYHNSIFRGKKLGIGVTPEQYAAIADGTFKDLYIGDFWQIDGVNYRIAAFDYYYNAGEPNFRQHHVVIVPDTSLYKHKMNNGVTSAGGYVGSRFYAEGLIQAEQIINKSFSGHILRHPIYLVNAVTNGLPSGSIWQNRVVDVMTEQMVYGSRIFSPVSDGINVALNQTIERTQLPLFALEPYYISAQTSLFWLRDVVSNKSFAMVGSYGRADYSYSDFERGVRPSFIIG